MKNRKPATRVHEVSATEASKKFYELLRMAERGEDVIIRRNGKRVAAIMGASRHDSLTPRVSKGRALEGPVRADDRKPLEAPGDQ